MESRFSPSLPVAFLAGVTAGVVSMGSAAATETLQVAVDPEDGRAPASVAHAQPETSPPSHRRAAGGHIIAAPMITFLWDGSAQNNDQALGGGVTVRAKGNVIERETSSRFSMGAGIGGGEAGPEGALMLHAMGGVRIPEGAHSIFGRLGFSFDAFGFNRRHHQLNLALPRAELGYHHATERLFYEFRVHGAAALGMSRIRYKEAAWLIHPTFGAGIDIAVDDITAGAELAFIADEGLFNTRTEAWFGGATSCASIGLVACIDVRVTQRLSDERQAGYAGLLIGWGAVGVGAELDDAFDE